MSRIVTRALGALGALLLLLVVVVSASGASYEPNVDIPVGFSGKHVSVRGVPLRVTQTGTGRDVLLIHGSPGSIEDWQSVAAALEGSFRVTAFDRPGNGYSGDTGEYSLEHNAETALALIEELKLERVIVAGHSYGGATALAMAVRAPRAVSAYVVVDSAAYTPSREANRSMRMLDLPLLGPGLGNLLSARIAPEQIRKGIIDQFNGRDPGGGFIELRTKIWSTPKVTHTIAAETLGSRANLEALSSRYRGIAAPVRILAQADNEFRRSTAERLHKDIRGSTLNLIPGTGHYVQFEKTAEVVDAIRQATAAR